MAVKLLLAL